MNSPHRVVECGGKISSKKQNVCLPRRVDDAQQRLEAEVLYDRPTARAGGGKYGHRRTKGQRRQQSGYAHSNARSRQAYSTPSRRIVMNIPISTMATTPSRTKTTAHGYMYTISMSKARKTSAMT